MCYAGNSPRRWTAYGGARSELATRFPHTSPRNWLAMVSEEGGISGVEERAAGVVLDGHRIWAERGHARWRWRPARRAAGGGPRSFDGNGGGARREPNPIPISWVCAGPTYTAGGCGDSTGERGGFGMHSQRPELEESVRPMGPTQQRFIRALRGGMRTRHGWLTTEAHTVEALGNKKKGRGVVGYAVHVHCGRMGRQRVEFGPNELFPFSFLLFSCFISFHFNFRFQI
jgi:hypothetical protein